MVTAVSDEGGDYRLVSVEQLDELIARAEIQQFLRLEGWVIIGCKPIRLKKNGRLGRERRRAFCLPDSNILDLKLDL